MEFITLITDWIVENEGLLSGIAALIVVGGVLVSPFGVSFRFCDRKTRSLFV